MDVAVTLALASAACFALGSALQHRAAGSTAVHNDAGPGLVLALLRRRSWLLGLGMSGLAFCLHALALRHGDLSVVQPVIVSGIVFAVVLRALLDRRLPSRHEVAWCAVTGAGLVLFIAVMPAREQDRPEPQFAAWFVGVGVALVIALMLVARRRSTDTRRGLLLGMAAGVLFGLVAGLVKLVLWRMSGGLLDLLGDWALWTMMVVGVSAVVLNQRAYQATRLSVSAPMLNIVQMVVAIGFGLLVFSEQLAEAPHVLGLQVLGLALIGLGIQRLAARDERSEQARARTEPANA